MTQPQASSITIRDDLYGEIRPLDTKLVNWDRAFRMQKRAVSRESMIDILSLGIGIIIGAIVGVGGSIWFVKRKLQKMQNNMFGPMDGMMEDPATQQDQPDMEAVMGDMMDIMEDPDNDELDLDDDEVDWKQ